MMSRLRRSIGALLLTVVVCAGASAGPAFGDTSAAAEPTTTQPIPTEPRSTEPTVPAVEPTIPVESTTAVEPTAPGDPATAEPVAEAVDLALTVTFDKPAFFADESITARARVTNNGTAPASRVLLESTGNLMSHNWGGFGYDGTRIEPGQTVEGTIDSRVSTADDLLTLIVTARTTAEPDVEPADNTVTLTVPITVVRGTFSGTVYGDRNGSGAMDPGEALAGLEVVVNGGHPDAEYTTTTDAAGRFAFSGLPRGDYRIGFAAPEWSFVWKSYAVDGEDDPDLVFRGARPIVSQLTASAGLDRSAYGVGDTAIVTLTLTNSDAVPIPDLTAVAYSNSAAIDLGELAQGGPGVTIPANAGRTFRISVAVDRHAADSGYLYVTCTFGAPPHSNGSVTATAEARIPGAVAAKVTGLVAQQLPVPGVTTMGPPAFGPRVPDLKVYLRDQFTGEIIARATTGAAGEFEFRDVPAGAHQLGLVGPWRIVYGGPRFYVGVHEGGLGPIGHLVLVAPGPDQPDPDPAPQPGAPTTPAPVPPDAGPWQQQLAATGANVVWLALGGLLTLLTGVALVLRPRRRKA